MRTYPIHIPCAIVLSEQLATDIMNSYLTQEAREEEIGSDIVESIANILEKNDLTFDYIGNFEGEANPFWSDTDQERTSRMEWHEYFGDTVYYLPLSKNPSLTSAAYNSIDEIVNEFRNDLKGFLPDDYPIEDHMYIISGVFFS